jgi:Ca2+-binding EF-hand superfamily protein
MGDNGDELLGRFREKMAQRGARGIMGLKRIFKIMDDDSSGYLDRAEFNKALKDYRVSVTQEEGGRLFSLFDLNGDGNISYDELLRGVVGEMNQNRKNLAKKAFNKLDRNQNGFVEVDDIKGVYNCKNHPDVKLGKKTEEEVLSEFLDTFELHYSLAHPDSRDKRISLDEFYEYYNNISMSIEDDRYFELMMTNAWNLNNVSYGKGFGAEY